MMNLTSDPPFQKDAVPQGKTIWPRRVEPEFLDVLSPGDPRAIRSRKDLLRVNGWMGNQKIMANELLNIFPDHAPKRILEIGAGDGMFLLGVCKRVAENWRGTTVYLLDRQAVASAQTVRDFENIGWRCELVQADVRNWLKAASVDQFDVIIANLFLHHFLEHELAELLDDAARRTRAFIAVEPRRWGWSLFFSRLLGLIGCSAVTRHDGVASVRAGFAGKELSQLWPAGGGWRLDEQPANWCSHLFVATRSD